jgi:aldehyde:ferredoxin oxidoreductase
MSKLIQNKVGNGIILHVDLTSKKIWSEEISAELRATFIGGRGCNARLLYQKLDPSVDPLSSHNILILGFGPLVGTIFPSASRTIATAKSPMTDAYGYSSAGGHFGAVARMTGVDHIIFYGKSPSPVYLLVHDMQKSEIRDAMELWGLNIPETVKRLSDLHGNCEVACIGPAGENGVRYSTIMVSLDRAIARTGMGCVMGQKNLKAIVVQRSHKLPASDKKDLTEFSKKYQKVFSQQMFSKALSHFGTPLIVSTRAYEGTLATKNFRDNLTEEINNLKEDVFINYQKKKKRCWMCPVGCHYSWFISEGKFKGTEGSKIEGENINTLGVNLSLFDYPAVLHLTKMINELGIDSHELGFTISWAMECWEYGLLTKKDTDGIALEWGNYEVISELIHKIAYRKGFGKVLAEGAMRASRAIGRGTEQYTWHIKGSSFPIWKKCGDTLGFCISTRGADHLHTYPFTIQGYDRTNRLASRLYGEDVKSASNPYSPEAKGRAVWWHENFKAIIDSLGICLFPVFATGLSKDHEYIHPAALAKILRAATGFPWTGAQLMECAERIIQIEKAFNVRCGMSRKDDYFIKKSTGREYQPQERVNLDDPGMLDEYYHFRGYTLEGLPTFYRLQEIGLNDVVEDLLPLNKVRDVSVPSLKSIMKEQDVY